MRRIIALFALVGLLVLAGCNPFLTKGYVMEKHDIPAHTYLQWHYVEHCITIGSGKNRTQSCYTTSYSTLEYIPEEWIITLNSCSPDTKKRDNCDENSVYVSRDTYRGLDIGQYADLTNVSL
jgi:hypothetical protein